MNIDALQPRALAKTRGKAGKKSAPDEGFEAVMLDVDPKAVGEESVDEPIEAPHGLALPVGATPGTPDASVAADRTAPTAAMGAMAPNSGLSTEAPNSRPSTEALPLAFARAMSSSSIASNTASSPVPTHPTMVLPSTMPWSPSTTASQTSAPSNVAPPTLTAASEQSTPMATMAPSTDALFQTSIASMTDHLAGHKSAAARSSNPMRTANMPSTPVPPSVPGEQPGHVWQASTPWQASSDPAMQDVLRLQDIIDPEPDSAPAKQPLATVSPTATVEAGTTEPIAMQGTTELTAEEPTFEAPKTAVAEPKESTPEGLVKLQTPRTVRVAVDAGLTVEVTTDEDAVDVIIEGDEALVQELSDVRPELEQELGNSGYDLRDFRSRDQQEAQPPAQEGVDEPVADESIPESPRIQRGHVLNAVA